MKRTVNVMFRSEFWGQGKSVAALSFTRPGLEQPRRLLVDMEYRDVSYKSPDDVDHPESLQFAYDFFQDEYNGGDVTQDAVTKLYTQIVSGEFPYDVLIFDNVALFQQELFILLSDKRVAMAVAKAMRGVYEASRLFLDYKFNPTDPGGYYPFLKKVIGALLLACRKKGVDVITTTESRNVWKNYGSKAKDEANRPKILGQTARAWDPWFQYADVLLVLSRIQGKREEGTATLTTYPTARMDTFNTKCSLPGLAPEFVLKNWSVFWDMVENRNVPTDEDFAKVEIPAAQASEEETPGPDTIKDAKKAIMDLAIKHGVLKSGKDKQGAGALVLAGAEAGLDMDNALAHYPQWVELIKEKWPLNGALDLEVKDGALDAEVKDGEGE
jgi:hypothetical protein